MDAGHGADGRVPAADRSRRTGHEHRCARCEASTWPVQGRPRMARMMQATALRTAARSPDSVPARGEAHHQHRGDRRDQHNACRTSSVSNSGSMMPPALFEEPVTGPGKSGRLAFMFGHGRAVVLSCDEGTRRR